MLKVVVATFPEFNDAGVGDNCDLFLSKLNKLACQWRFIAINTPDGKEDEDVEPWLRDVNKACVLCI